jgi:putative toxin-antitoxin system antitoxin component (TIGR02293 family)
VTGRVSETVRIMGGERVLGRRVRVMDDLRRAVEAGLPVQTLTEVTQHLGGAELRYRIVPKATLHRRKTKLTPAESERVERLARVIALAEQVWEDEGLAREFLMSPQTRLGGVRPVDMARSELGARQVEDLLWEMEYSLPA